MEWPSERDKTARHVKSEPSDDFGSSSNLTANAIDNADNLKAQEDVPQFSSNHQIDYIEQLLSNASVEQLEAGVSIGLQLIEGLKEPLQTALERGHAVGVQWLSSIQRLQDEASPARTVIGVILVPTNGMRACTASATEISYNHSDDPEQLYRAEVEFISAADWEDELKTLLGDMLDDYGRVSIDCSKPDTEANLAYSKIMAVYPHLTKEASASTSPAALAQQSSILGVVGSVKELRATTSSQLFDALQQYVDSKEKVQRSGQKMEFWPLIKVVRIYCKADALSTGAVIVDLPGFNDSNAARAAVAESYRKTCDSLWITAAIQRAVDDKTAKDLLGTSFKRQLMYDGILSAITFICTKTDDILESEVAGSLGIEDTLSQLWAQIAVLRSKKNEVEHKIKDLKKEKKQLEHEVEGLDRMSEKWVGMAAKLEHGETVYRPLETPRRKRKRNPSASPNQTRKRRQSFDSVSDADSSSDSDGSDMDSGEAGQDTNLPPLTRHEIQTQLALIKSQQKDLRKAKKTLNGQVTDARKELGPIAAEEKALVSEVKSICVQGRNEYAREALKCDFAKGVKELDQQTAIEEDDAAFNPDEDARDYNEVARAFPVFTVSSRAYQRLSGRLSRDAVHVNGFTSLQHTEIPQLQDHAKILTEGRRVRECRCWLNKLSQLLNSIRLWITFGHSGGSNTEGQIIDAGELRDRLTTLEKKLHETVKALGSSFEKTVEAHLYKNFDRLIPTGSASAVAIANTWGASPSAGGLFWQTYKATVRHRGQFFSTAGVKSFNDELWEPINKHLVGSWERVFQRRLPSASSHFVRSCEQEIQAFHADTLNSVEPNIAGHLAGLKLLDQQVRVYIAMVHGATTALAIMITERQRVLNREFATVIQGAMRGAYDVCAAEHGLGSYSRMKTLMESHVDTARHTMFRAACDTVKQHLEQILMEAKMMMVKSITDVFTKLESDFLGVFIRQPADAQTRDAPSAERLRGELCRSLEQADTWFADLSSSKDEDEETLDGVPAQPRAVLEAGVSPG